MAPLDKHHPVTELKVTNLQTKIIMIERETYNTEEVKRNISNTI
jgi:hypothetical protein